MSELFGLFAAALGLAAALAAVSIWAPRVLWLKVGALTITALFVPAVYVAMVELLSRPKPVALERIDAALAEATVLGADLREEEAIFVWLRLPGVEEPRAYVLPWDQGLAEQLHGAQREARERGTEVHARNLFRTGEGRERPMFYAQPQPASPPKQPSPRGGPLVFDSGAPRSTAQGSGSAAR
ncbi:MAG: hypothetical protein KJ025_02920 [Burkholderiales bacterium]|nr:hypothetical protein [Burkholderiales bacterium]